MEDLLQFVVGLGVLLLGAELLVRGASNLAAAVGVSPLVVGLTVVAYGTSAPELAVSVDASLTGRGDLALGNVVGSNIMNVLLVLGLSAAITPVTVAHRLIGADVPIMIGLSGLLFLLLLDGSLGRLEGAALFAGAIAYTIVIVRYGRRKGIREDAGAPAPPPRGFRTHALHAAFVVIGLILLPLGADWIVKSATAFASSLGMSEVLVGLTIVAVGTSLPEIATSVVASVRGARDMAVGNVVGSNIFNILLVLGLAGAVAPDGIGVPPSILRFDVPVMLVAAGACLPVCFTDRRIDRWEGWLFLGYYAAYVLYLVLDAQGHDALPAFSTVMAVFVLPLTVLTLLILALRFARRRKGAGEEPAEG